MFDSLYIGATGMVAHQNELDAIANNIANINTVGFRRGVVSFEEVSSQLIPTALGPLAPAAVRNAASAQGAGSVAQTSLSTLAGPLESTGQELDVAINGAGFFEVLGHDGTPAYTRAGSLQVNSDGLLATADGSPLASQIRVPADAQSIVIGADGKLTATLPNSTTPVLLGRIELVNFPNPAALTAAGNTQYTAPPEAGTAQSGAPGTQGLGQLQQGYLETSDVQMTQEMVTLMLAQRGYELNSKVVQAADQLWSLVNSLTHS
jgi:flagellar basal-body rod protein FlgG